MEFLSEEAVEISRCFDPELVEICLWMDCG